jgi:Heavy metal associated domain 2
MTKPQLYIAHQVRGRVRMKIPAAKGNPDLLRQISETFAAVPGIEQIAINPATGSMVVHYDADRHDEFHGGLQHHYDRAPDDERPPKTEIDDLARKIEAEAEFLSRHSDSARAIVDFFRSVDHEIKVATNNTIDLKIVFAAAIIGFTVVEVGATAATPVWVTLAIFGLNHFIEMHTPHANLNPTRAPVVVEA